MTSPDDDTDARPTGPPPGSGDTLSVRRQWYVVAVLVVFVLVIPLTILVWPPTGFGFRDAYLGLSVLPGIVLGGLVVWLAIRDRV